MPTVAVYKLFTSSPLVIVSSWFLSAEKFVPRFSLIFYITVCIIQGCVEIEFRYWQTRTSTHFIQRFNKYVRETERNSGSTWHPSARYKDTGSKGFDADWLRSGGPRCYSELYACRQGSLRSICLLNLNMFYVRPSWTQSRSPDENLIIRM